MTQTKSQPLTNKEQETNMKFKAKWEELQDWGLTEGIYIDAYIDISHNGIRPYVAYRPLTPVEVADYSKMSKLQVKTDLAIAKDEKKTV